MSCDNVNFVVNALVTMMLTDVADYSKEVKVGERKMEDSALQEGLLSYGPESREPFGSNILCCG